VPGAFAAVLIGLPLLGVIYPEALWLWLTIVTVYLCCSLIAASLTAKRNGWFYLAALPVIFACYHFAYGFGFLLGILDFILLRRGPAAVFMALTRAPAAPPQRH
jgi:hypothetical protein